MQSVIERKVQTQLVQALTFTMKDWKTENTNNTELYKT